MQFLAQVLIFSLVGVAVWGLSRVLRCNVALPDIPNAKKSSYGALGAVGISMAPAYLLMVRQRLLHGATSDYAPRFEHVSALWPQLLLVLIYVVPAGVFMIRNRESLRTTGISTRNLWQSLLIGAGLALLTFYFRPGGLMAKVQGIQARHGVALVFFAGVGFGEEFLFRGYLQNRLAAWLGRWPGWVAASVAMAIVHLPHRSLIQGMSFGVALVDTLALIPVSLLMGFVMLRTQNIVAPGLFHTFADWVNTLK